MTEIDQSPAGGTRTGLDDDRAYSATVIPTPQGRTGVWVTIPDDPDLQGAAHGPCLYQPVPGAAPTVGDRCLVQRANGRDDWWIIQFDNTADTADARLDALEVPPHGQLLLAAPPYAVVDQATAGWQTIGAASPGIGAWSVASTHDVGGWWDGTSGIVAGKAGLIVAQATVAWAGSATGARGVRFLINGTVTSAQSQALAQGTAVGNHTHAHFHRLGVAGQKIEVQVWQGSGANLNITSGMVCWEWRTA